MAELEKIDFRRDRLNGTHGFELASPTKDLASLQALSGVGQSWTRFRYMVSSGEPWQGLRMKPPGWYPIESEAPLPTGVAAHEIVRDHLEKRDEVVSTLHDVFEETFGVIVLLVDGGYALRRGEHEALRQWIGSVGATTGGEPDRLTTLAAAAAAIVDHAERDDLARVDVFDQAGVCQAALRGTPDMDAWLNEGFGPTPPRGPGTGETLGWAIDGMHAYDAGLFDEARALLRRAIDAEPFGGSASYYMAGVHRHDANHEQAAGDFFHAGRGTIVSRGPGRGDCLEMVATSWHLGGDLERARQAYNVAIAWAEGWDLEPQHRAVALTDRGELLLDVGEVDAAIADLRAALDLVPGYAPALIQKERAIKGGGTW